MKESGKFQKDVSYNVLKLAIKARSDLLYAKQMIEETYVMKKDYKMPFNTHSDLYRANKVCIERAIPAIDEIVAYTASVYVKCCEDAEKKEKHTYDNS